MRDGDGGNPANKGVSLAVAEQVITNCMKTFIVAQLITR